MADFTLHFARFQVSDDDDFLADEIRRIRIPLCNARQDLAMPFIPRIQTEFQQLVRAFDFLAMDPTLQQLFPLLRG